MERAKVLVVEDDFVTAESIATVLGGYSYIVTGTASTAQEAISLVESTRPDLILMDIGLKGEKDGLTAAEEIHARYDIPVVYLTAYVDESIVQRARITEPFGYLLKPFHPKELLPAVELALHKHRMERESRERIGTILNSIDDGVITTDEHNIVSFVNQKAETLTGWNQNEAIGKDISQVFQTTEISVHKTELLAKDGTRTIIEHSVSRIQDLSGNVSGKVMVFRDVTVRKNAEEALRESELKFRSLVNTAPDVIATISSSGILTSLNPPFEKLTGWSRGEWLGKHFSALVSEDDVPFVIDVFERLMKNEIPHAGELQLHTKSGEPVSVELTATPQLQEHTVVGGLVFLRNITERKHAREALLKSEVRFRAVFEGAPLGIVLLDRDGRILKANRAFETMLQYRNGECVGKQLNSFTYAGDTETAMQHFEQLLRGECSQYIIDIRYRRKDGSHFWASSNCSTLGSFAGQPPLTVAMIKDISKRKHIERELRESETRFRTVFTDSPIGIAIMDGEGTFLKTNPTLHAMLGFAEKELQGKNFAEVLHPEDAEADLQCFRDLLSETRERYQLQERFIRKDGSTAWGNVNVAFMDESDLPPRLIIRMIEDITLRKQAEQQMPMLAHTLNSMNDSVAVTDSRDVIIAVNPAFEKCYGYKEEEILGQSLLTLRLTTLPIEVADQIRSTTLSAGWSGELTLLRKSGDAFPAQLSRSVVRDDAGNAIALVEISRDITQQKEMQQQLSDAERQRSADLRRLAASVQRAQEDERQRISRELHDNLCQRLSGMKLHIEVLEDDIRTVDKKAYRKILGFKNHLDEMITEVRNLSSNLRPTVIDDFGLVTALDLLCKGFRENHKIQVKFETSGIPSRYSQSHADIEFYRITQEALSNVAKHAHASKVGIKLIHDTQAVTLIIEDNGKGFDKSDVLKKRLSGHGLGFISMRERADLLGGTFEATTAPHRGTRIKVTVPLETEMEVA